MFLSFYYCTYLTSVFFNLFNIHCSKNEVFYLGFLQFLADLVVFTEEIFNGKHFLCSDTITIQPFGSCFHWEIPDLGLDSYVIIFSY